MIRTIYPWKFTNRGLQLKDVPCFELRFYKAKFGELRKSEFVERFPEFSLFYRLFSPLDSEMICIFPYFYPCEESAREIREIFI